MPLPNQPGANNFFRQADLDRQLRPRHRPPGRALRPERQRLRPLHLLEPRRADPGRLRRRHRRHRHLGLRQPDDQDQRLRRRLDAHLLVHDRQRVPLLLVAGGLRRGAAAVRRRLRPPPPRFRARSPTRSSPAASPASRSTATSAARGSAASARPTSCRSSSTRTSSSSSTACRGCGATTRFKFGVDIIAPMKNEYMDVPATRGSLRFRNSFTGNPMADYLLGYVADLQLSNVWVGRPAPLGLDVLRPGRLEGELEAVLEPRPALRLHHPRARGAATRRPTSIPAGTGSLVFAKDGSLEERGLVKPDTNNFAPRDRHRLQAEREDGAARRLRDLLQPVRPRRQRGPARAQPARPHQQRSPATSAARARSSCCSRASRPAS